MKRLIKTKLNESAQGRLLPKKVSALGFFIVTCFFVLNANGVNAGTGNTGNPELDEMYNQLYFETSEYAGVFASTNGGPLETINYRTDLSSECVGFGNVIADPYVSPIEEFDFQNESMDQVFVHTHPLSAYALDSSFGYSEEELQQVCDGDLPAFVSGPSATDMISTVKNSDKFDSENLHSSAQILEPGGVWRLAIANPNSNGVRKLLGDDSVVLTPQEVDHAKIWYGSQQDLAYETDPGRRLYYINHMETSAAALGLDLEFTPNEYFYGGTQIPSCVPMIDDAILGGESGGCIADELNLLDLQSAAESTETGASAEPDGLVPCNGPDCTACDLVQLGKNILNFLIVISISIAGIAFAVAGFQMLTSAGNESKLSKAKGIMTNVIVGILLILAAWLIVDTVMKQFVDEGKIGPWNEIRCVAQPMTPTP